MQRRTIRRTLKRIREMWMMQAMKMIKRHKHLLMKIGMRILMKIK